MRAPRLLTPLGITLTYLAVGAAWILFSDRFIADLPGAASVRALTYFQTAKGLAFIAITGGILYALMRAQFTAMSRSRWAIRERDRRYRRAFERSAAPMLVFDATTNRVVEANAAAVALYGWERPCLVGRSLAEITIGETAAAERELAEAQLGSGRSFVARHRTAAGTEIDVELWLTPVQVGRLRLSLAIVQDVTLRRLAEQALAASEERYRRLLNDASDAIFVANHDGILVDVNIRACEVLGYRREELIGRSMQTLYPAEDIRRVPLQFAELDAGRVVLLERRLVRADGRLVPVELTAKQLEDGTIQAIVRDITERRRLEEQLRQSQKMEAVGQLTGGIAHDLNNVLTVVLTNAQLVGDGLPADRSDLRADVAELRDAAQRGATMIRKLLRFSRQDPLEVDSLDLARVVSDLRDTLVRLLPAHIHVVVDAPDPVPVRGDGGAVEQIVLNLATNARDAMPNGGTLRFEVRVTAVPPGAAAGSPTGGCYGCIVARDTGVGMDAETRVRIFEPFFTTKPQGQGTGLGMTMVYGLVRQLGGFIEVDSAPGAGTAVRVALPVEAAEPVPPPGAAVSQRWPRGTETILLVEDELPVRRAAMRLLSQLGYTMLTASDGQEALELVHRHESGIDLVLSDIVMPRLGGRGLYDALQRGGRAVPFLFTSGYGGDELRDLGVTAPPLLRKPWTAAELATMVREVLDEARSER